MRDRAVFELCAQTPEACLAARLGGADRVEICTNIQVAGLTPDRALVEEAIDQSGLPVHVLLRPNPDTFVYSRETFTAVSDSLRMAKAVGAAGVCLGFLNPDRTIALDPTRELVAMAGAMAVTFHRAFDETPNLEEALEAVIDAGCDRVLTSGGAANVLDGAPVLAQLIARARGRIEIAAGGGLTLENARRVARVSGAKHYHGSLQRSSETQPSLAHNIQTMIRLLADTQAEPHATPNLQAAPFLRHE